jgi:hypothetical protein
LNMRIGWILSSSQTTISLSWFRFDGRYIPLDHRPRRMKASRRQGISLKGHSNTPAGIQQGFDCGRFWASESNARPSG